MKNIFKALMKEISPYVIVVGSYAKGTNNANSDIDFYVKRKPQEVIDEEMARTFEIVEESYIKEIIDILKKYKVQMDSIMIGHVAVDVQLNIPKMLEFSWHYKVPKLAMINRIRIEGVAFDSAIDNKDTDYRECIDYVE